MNIPSHLLLALIRAYQFTLSLFMGNNCRYHPTCSNYTAQAVRRFGAGRGSILGILRICRCHPWREGGHDPVPEKYPKFFSKKRWTCVKSSPNPAEQEP